MYYHTYRRRHAKCGIGGLKKSQGVKMMKEVMHAFGRAFACKSYVILLSTLANARYPSCCVDATMVVDARDEVSTP